MRVTEDPHPVRYRPRVFAIPSQEVELRQTLVALEMAASR